jgi:hypothetical protein
VFLVYPLGSFMNALRIIHHNTALPTGLVFKLDTLSTARIDHAAPVTTPLSLVLLLGETLSLCNNQLGVRAVGVIVGDVGVASELGVDFDVRLDALEAVFDVAAL